ncbi:glycoside hydrolase family 65 protein [Rugosimonospora africana]|uniref:Glycoside hydrolase family 65 central catalytic domain-containing protein n=1 Tax=Rugosimonospora africana TaxID=556532 RepID=A0A8J3QX86_9ACTN|nr:glycoside hydrolase family 65 protein [Rugosimonospora africana]GIH17483.1 hypothetical protein Raf01_56550 [Rugosimonospora africana]
MAGPISPRPVHQWQPDYLPAYLSNGLIGLRVGHIPLLYGIAMLSGFEGLDPATLVESFAPVPYPLGGDIRIGRAALSDPGRAKLREQRYDFSCGELITIVDFETDEARAEIEILTLCSRTQPTIVLQEVKLRVDRDTELSMSTSVDARNTPGSWTHDEPGSLESRSDWPEGPFRWRSLGELSACGITFATELLGMDRFERSFDHRSGELLTTNYAFYAKAGQEYRLRQVVSLVPQSLHSQPHMQAARLVDEARWRGFDNLRQDNRVAWERLWRGRIVLEGASTRWQAFVDAAFYYLQASVHASSPSATSVFGLSYWPNYHYYRGHLMWDLETFAVPPLLLTQPAAAQGMLRYRSSRLDAANSNATLTGYHGAQFPWESSLRMGHEAAPLGARGPATEHHVSMDVAIAFARYVHATGDKTFARNEAWPLLSGVADWIESRVERTDRGYEIRGVIGIAETGTTVDNSVFTNMAAVVALRETTAIARDLQLPYRRCWESIADGMVIPKDQRQGIIVNHDQYRPDEEQGATPEAAAGMFPAGYQVGPELERQTLKYYVSMADEYAGQPMLSAMLGVYAARLGDRARSLDLFEKGYGEFIVDPYTITLEYSPSAYPDHPRAGPFTANLGGFLTSCLYGLTGMQLSSGDPSTWFRRKVILPKGWDAIHSDSVWVRGRPVSLHAGHGDDRGQFGEGSGETDTAAAW